MLKLRMFLISILLVIGFVACDSVVYFELDRPFRLPQHETAVNMEENVWIRFDQVVKDSRCPIEYLCVLPGNAQVEFTMKAKTQKKTFILNTYDEPRSLELFGYTVELKNLEPQNSDKNPPAQKDYLATLVISKVDNVTGKCEENSDCGKGEFCSKEPQDCEGSGQCEDTPEICLDIYDPVCGCDMRTYSNDCEAAGHGINVAYEGECQEEIHDDSCDDGTEPLCKMLPPECTKDEILAYQDNCYLCVNPDTCVPWGEPNCKTDADCGANEFCDPCGSSSCPMCEDCVPACRLPIR
ncbi:MAG: Kazal-type serine protease inhibitor family protein [Desulfobacteraceae bacterium]